MSVLIEDVDSWGERLFPGVEKLWDDPGERWRFANGALSDGRGWHRPPPDDEKENLEARIEFAELKRRRKKAELKAATQNYIFGCQLYSSGNGGPLPGPEYLAALRDGKEEMIELEKAVNALKNERQENSSHKQLDWHQQQAEQRRSEAQAALNELAQVLGSNQSQYH
jgi:hypothetical protein